MSLNLERPNQQFAIIMGVEDRGFQVIFPSDIVQYDDNECWIECRFYSPDKNELLVVIGWTLLRQDDNKCWLIHQMDWQDFRDAYRPGIGREEWERICG